MSSEVHTEGVIDVSAQLLAEMSLPDADQRRVAMSWEDYLALPDELFAEFVDGEVVVTPRPAILHAALVARMTVVLAMSLPMLEVLTGGGVSLPGNRLRGPDVMVVRELRDAVWVQEAPIVVVEVLSPSTRSEDLLRKAPEYAGAGVEQFWVVDPEHRSIEVHSNVDGTWRPLLHLDDAHPTGQVSVGEHAIVSLDLNAIFPGG